ncbi:MAG: hypothetical protein ACSLE6_15130 [Mycobacterium sp.]
MLGVVAIGATLGAAGCSSAPEPAASEPAASSSNPLPGVPPSPSAPTLPEPAALTDVLYRLADPAVPGADKLTLIEGATPDDAAVLDTFANALRDNGFAPLTFAATALGWSDRVAGDVTTTIDVTPSADVGVFTFPMDFHPVDGVWQLSGGTAELLLTFGAADTDTTATSPAPTPAEPSQTP